MVVMMKPFNALIGFSVLHEGAGKYERDREQREKGDEGKWEDFSERRSLWMRKSSYLPSNENI